MWESLRCSTSCATCRFALYCDVYAVILLADLLLTTSQAPAENFPFCTIEPNHSQVAVPDDRCIALLPPTLELPHSSP